MDDTLEIDEENTLYELFDVYLHGVSKTISNALLAANIPMCEHENQAGNYSFFILDAVQKYHWTNRQPTLYLYVVY